MSREIPPLPATPHRRFNPLTGEWVLVSPQRATRPWHGQVEPAPPAHRPVHDPSCYLCPGNARAGGATNPRYESTYVFDNDFPALSPDGLPAGAVEDGPLVARPERGRGRVACFSPRHDLTLAEMDTAAVRRVVEVWRAEAQRDITPEIAAASLRDLPEKRYLAE